MPPPNYPNMIEVPNVADGKFTIGWSHITGTDDVEFGLFGDGPNSGYWGIVLEHCRRVDAETVKAALLGIFSAQSVPQPVQDGRRKFEIAIDAQFLAPLQV